MTSFRAGIPIALPPSGMPRIPAIVLSAILALTPVIGAVCADGCAGETARMEVVPTCGHDDTSANAPAMNAAACGVEGGEVALAEVRGAGLAPASSAGIATMAPEPHGRPEQNRYLQHQPPSPPARLTLRI